MDAKLPPEPDRNPKEEVGPKGIVAELAGILSARQGKDCKDPKDCKDEKDEYTEYLKQKYS